MSESLIPSDVRQALFNLSLRATWATQADIGESKAMLNRLVKAGRAEVHQGRTQSVYRITPTGRAELAS